MSRTHAEDRPRIPQTLVAGIGSPHGDDQVGWRVVRQIRNDLRCANVTCRQAASPVDLLDWMDGVERLMICDACRGLGRVGEVRRWEWPAWDVQKVGWCGTHDLSLPAVLALAQRLGRLPGSVVVWAMEGSNNCAEESLSSGASNALPDLVDQMVRELNATDSSPSVTRGSRVPLTPLYGNAGTRVTIAALGLLIPKSKTAGFGRFSTRQPKET